MVKFFLFCMLFFSHITEAMDPSPERKRARSLPENSNNEITLEPRRFSADMAPGRENYWQRRLDKIGEESSSTEGHKNIRLSRSPKEGDACIKRRDGGRNLVISEDSKLDISYLRFLRKVEGFEHVQENRLLYQNPTEQLRNIIEQNPTIKLRATFSYDALPKGLYANYCECPFTGRELKDYQFYKPPSQGWKLHISALPESAKTIAGIVMGVIDCAEATYGYTYFKIVATLPSMRTFYYLIGNLAGEGRETQIGKFMTIYPANNEHAILLAKAIDNALYHALLADIIKPEDLYPLKGEAIVGKSGGVFARYGSISLPGNSLRAGSYVVDSSSNLPLKTKEKYLDPQKSTEVQLERGHIKFSSKRVLDNRYYPWPDFMNKADPSWENAPDPFPGLNMRWISPSDQIITWAERPNYWSDLQR